jgi:hypothetical protein
VDETVVFVATVVEAAAALATGAALAPLLPVTEVLGADAALDFGKKL